MRLHRTMFWSSLASEKANIPKVRKVLTPNSSRSCQQSIFKNELINSLC